MRLASYGLKQQNQLIDPLRNQLINFRVFALTFKPQTQQCQSNRPKDAVFPSTFISKENKIPLVDWGPGSDNLSQKSLNQPLLIT